jgi:hypothetical protein
LGQNMSPARKLSTRHLSAPPVISNRAGRLFLPHSLPRMRRPLQREISLFLDTKRFSDSLTAPIWNLRIIRARNENNMKKQTEKREARDELRREYDLSKLEDAVRGKYLAYYRAGTNLVLLSPDVAEHFPDEQCVNAPLRTLIHAAKRPLRR